MMMMMSGVGEMEALGNELHSLLTSNKSAWLSAAYVTPAPSPFNLDTTRALVFKIEKDYKELLKKKLPVTELGYSSAESLLSHLPNVFLRRKSPSSRQFEFKLKPKENTQHIRNLVTGNKGHTASGKSKEGKTVGKKGSVSSQPTSPTKSKSAMSCSRASANLPPPMLPLQDTSKEATWGSAFGSAKKEPEDCWTEGAVSALSEEWPSWVNHAELGRRWPNIAWTRSLLNDPRIASRPKSNHWAEETELRLSNATAEELGLPPSPAEDDLELQNRLPAPFKEVVRWLLVKHRISGPEDAFPYLFSSNSIYTMDYYAEKYFVTFREPSLRQNVPRPRPPSQPLPEPPKPKPQPGDLIPADYQLGTEPWPQPEESHLAILAQFFSQEHFYVILKNHHSSLGQLMASLTAYATTSGLPLQECRPGILAAAPYEADGFHRVQVLDVNRNDVKLLFVDFGTEDWAVKGSLRRMRYQDVEIPAQALACSLHNAALLKDLDQEKVKSAFEDYFLIGDATGGGGFVVPQGPQESGRPRPVEVFPAEDGGGGRGLGATLAALLPPQPIPPPLSLPSPQPVPVRPPPLFPPTAPTGSAVMSNGSSVPKQSAVSEQTAVDEQSEESEAEVASKSDEAWFQSLKPAGGKEIDPELGKAVLNCLRSPLQGLSDSARLRRLAFLQRYLNL